MCTDCSDAPWMKRFRKACCYFLPIVLLNQKADSVLFLPVCDQSAWSESLDRGGPAAGSEGDIGPQPSAQRADKAAGERHVLIERSQSVTGETLALLYVSVPLPLQ